jgi:hypothetical protein
MLLGDVSRQKSLGNGEFCTSSHSAVVSKRNDWKVDVLHPIDFHIFNLAVAVFESDPFDLLVTPLICL